MLPTNAICPACGEMMTPSARSGIQFMACTACRMNWFQNEDLDHLMKGLERRFSIIDIESLRRESDSRKAKTFDREVVYFSCPDCKHLMYQKMYGLRSYILTHQCAVHGTLLTEQNLGLMADYLSRGGDLLEMSHTIEELSQRIKELGGKLAEKGFSAGPTINPLLVP